MLPQDSKNFHVYIEVRVFNLDVYKQLNYRDKKNVIFYKKKILIDFI